MSKALATKNVAAVLLSVAMVFGVTFAFASPAKAQTLEGLQAQIQALLAQIASLQGGTSTSGGACTTFTRNHQMGDTGGEVMAIQKFLNSNGAVIASTGAGSPGNETSYFGGLTRAAVSKFQAANGISPTAGYWGPMTRAKANTMCSGTPGTGVPVTGNGLRVMLASDSPVNVALVQNQGIAELGKFTFVNPTGSSITVTSVSFQRVGASTDSVLSNIYLYSGAMRLTDPAGISNSVFSFNNSAGVFVVPAGGTITVSVRADIAGSSSGQQVGVRLNSVASSGMLDTSVVFPITGGIQTISAATIATATWGAATPSGGTFAPANDTTVFQASLTINNRAVWLKSIQFENRGSTDSSDFQNMKLFVKGVQVGGTASVVNDRVVFDLSGNPLKLETGASELRLVGDIVGGSGETFDFQIRRGIDINLVDSELNQSLAPSSPTAVTANTVEGVGFSIVRANTSPTDNVAVGATGVLWARFEARAAGDNLKIEEISLHVDAGTSAQNGTTMDNVRITLDGVQVGSTADITSATTTFALGSSMTLTAGKTHIVEIYGDAKDSSGTNYASTAQRRVGLTIDNADTEGISSGDRLASDISEVEGNVRTVTSSSLSGTKASGYGNQTMVAGTNNAKLGSFTLSSGSTGAVNVNTLRIDLSTANAASITDLRLVDPTTGTQIGSAKSSASTENIFSVNISLPISTTKTIDVVGNIKSGSNAGPFVATLDSTSGGTDAFGQSVSIGGDATLQTITVAGSGTLNTAVGVSPDNANVIAGSSEVKVGAFKFTALNSNFTVQELMVKVPADAATSVASVILKLGATTLGTQALQLSSGTQSHATATFTGLTFAVAQNTEQTLDIYVSIPTIASGASTGKSITVLIDGDHGFKAVDAAGTQVTTLTGSTDLSSVSATGKGTMVVRKSIPILTSSPITTTLTAGTNQVLGRFTVAADAAGDIGWKNLVFTIAKSDAVTIGATSTIKLWNGSNIVSGNFATTTASGGAEGGESLQAAATSGILEFVADTEQQISGSSSATYELRGTIGGSLGGYEFLDVSIANPNTTTALAQPYATVNATFGNTDPSFTWTDRSVVSEVHSLTTSDWSDDYLVKTLPLTIGSRSVSI